MAGQCRDFMFMLTSLGVLQNSVAVRTSSSCLRLLHGALTFRHSARPLRSRVIQKVQIVLARRRIRERHVRPRPAQPHQLQQQHQERRMQQHRAQLQHRYATSTAPSGRRPVAGCSSHLLVAELARSLLVCVCLELIG